MEFEELREAVEKVELVDAHAHNIVAIDSAFPFVNSFSEAAGEALSSAHHSVSFKVLSLPPPRWASLGPSTIWVLPSGRSLFFIFIARTVRDPVKDVYWTTWWIPMLQDDLSCIICTFPLMFIIPSDYVYICPSRRARFLSKESDDFVIVISYENYSVGYLKNVHLCDVFLHGSLMLVLIV